MRKLLAVVLLAAGMTGCRDATPTGPYADVAGTYQLAAVNESPVPYVLYLNSASRTEVIRGKLVLRADSTYSHGIDVRRVYSTGAFEGQHWGDEQGRYTMIGSEITFTIPAGGDMAAHSYKGVIGNGVVTLPVGSMTMRYEK